MNAVGECVGRVERGLSPPRGETEPPITVVSGAADLTASYVWASSARYEEAARSAPFLPNWGIQNRFRFGSLPTIR